MILKAILESLNTKIFVSILCVFYNLVALAIVAF